MALPYVPATTAEGPAGPGFWAALPVPVQTVGIYAALALGFGVIVGTALSPNLAGPLAGPVVVVQAPPPAAPAPAPVTGGGGGGGGLGGGGGGSAPVVSTTPTTTSTSTDDTSNGDGDGGGKKKKKKPKEEKPTYINGTVVHNNPVAVSYAVAGGGSVSAIHAKSPTALPAVGTVVRVPVRLLANRTFAEDGKRQDKGQAAQATFAGVVTDARNNADPANPAPDVYTVSLRGWSILIHMPPDDADPLTPDRLPPALGSFATVTVDIRTPPVPPTALPPPPSGSTPAALSCAAPPPAVQPVYPTPPIVPAKELHQVSLVAQPSTAPSPVQIETVVQGTCPPSPTFPTGEALLSSDDIREGMTDILVTGSGVDVTLLAPGTPLIANATVATQPVPPLTGVQSDAGIAGASSSAGSQGDLRIFSAGAGASAAAADRAVLKTERRVRRAYERAKRKLAKRKHDARR